MQTPPSLPLKKPRTFMLAGVGLLVLGIFYVLGLISNVVMALIPAIRSNNAALRLLDEDPSYVPVYYAGLILNGILGLVAIAAGIGLMKSKNWGRMLGIAWAAITILSAPLGLWLMNKYVHPAMVADMQKEFTRSGIPPEHSELFVQIMNVATMAFMVIWVLLCIVLIIFLARPKMKTWCHLQENQTPGLR